MADVNRHKSSATLVGGTHLARTHYTNVVARIKQIAVMTAAAAFMRLASGGARWSVATRACAKTINT